MMRDVELGELAPDPTPPAAVRTSLSTSANRVIASSERNDGRHQHGGSSSSSTSATTADPSPPIASSFLAASSALAERVVGQLRRRVVKPASPVSAVPEESPHSAATPASADQEKDEIAEYFEAQKERHHGGGFLGSVPFAFLLWGSQDSERGETWAVDVPLSSTAEYNIRDEVAAFERLRRRYAEVRGVLGSCFYLRGAVVVRPVKVAISEMRLSSCTY